MYKYLVIVLLLVAAHQQDYFLSPAIPPTAFVNEYYTTQFRILGLDNPKFTFAQLPKFLRGSSDGTIEGTPDKTGSYSAKVNFVSGKSKGSRDIVIRVAPSVSSTEQLTSSVFAQNKFIVINPNSPLTFIVGDKIDLSLGAQNGKNPYTWTYMNLPKQITANGEGKLSGIFDQQGYYSFSASCSDGSGSIADSYLTFNIQPKGLTKKSNLIEVPNRNAPIRYDIKQVEAQQLAASHAVFAAVQVVNENQNVTAGKREDYGKTTMALNFAAEQEKAADANVAEKLVAYSLAQKAAEKAHEVLENGAKIVDLTKLNLHNADNVVEEAQNDLKDAQDKVDHLTADLKTANNEFINAQTETSQTAQNTKAALTANLNARNVYNLAFDTYSNAKKILQGTQERKTQADNIVDNAKNSLNIVNQANDNAQSDLTTAQNVYEKSYSALNNANNLVSKLRQTLNDAGDQLGVAKFNLQQALNNLYVAQSKKEQADKATAIVRSQSSVLPQANSTSTYIFAGCVQQAYPTISGSVRIDSANSLGYKLASGNTLLFGGCTQKPVDITAGDVVQYEGYLKDGLVHAITINKTQ